MSAKAWRNRRRRARNLRRGLGWDPEAAIRRLELRLEFEELYPLPPIYGDPPMFRCFNHNTGDYS